MLKVLLIQLPIPQINFGKRTANVPLAGACLKQSLSSDLSAQVGILPESISSYIGDAAMIRLILSSKPDVIGFSVFNWNLHRSIYLAQKIREVYPVITIFGGPEITKDNPALQTDAVDYCVYGEGESVIQRILAELNNSGFRRNTHINSIQADPYNAFQSTSSPYLNGLLEPEVDGLMYLETQRGCIYHCGFCFYNKSRKKIATVDDQVVLDAVQWAIDHEVPELCLVDPSLNSRPGLKPLLSKISRINNDRALSINAELRAEAIDAELADLFAAAGFTSFEIGLQSINPKALEIMRRKTDLKRFLKGTSLLKKRGIIPKIDLIVGLPGDDLEGFKKSLMFVVENNLADDIQVFPLSILPGTAFRQNSNTLGLVYAPYPPYLINHTPAYSSDDIYLSFDYAESLFDVSLFPAPHLDVSYKHFLPGEGESADLMVDMKGKKYIRTLILNAKRPLDGIESVAGRLTSPYQIIISRTLKDFQYVCRVIEILTEKNPFTPLEVIFMEPEQLPDTEKLLSAAKLFRPGYLDEYNTYQYGIPGNRSMLLTVVTKKRAVSFEGEMKRQVFWWENSYLPDVKEIEALSDFDGILIDTEMPSRKILSWQDRMAEFADDMIYISFADVNLQKRWMGLTAADEFSGLLFGDSV